MMLSAIGILLAAIALEVFICASVYYDSILRQIDPSVWIIIVVIIGSVLGVIAYFIGKKLGQERKMFAESSVDEKTVINKRRLSILFSFLSSVATILLVIRMVILYA